METTLRRRKGLRRLQGDIAEVERAEEEAVAAAALTQEALNRAKRATATGAAATPSSPTRQQSVYSRAKRPGDDVSRVASSARPLR